MNRRKVTVIMVIESNKRFATIEEQTKALVRAVGYGMGVESVESKVVTFPEPIKSRAERLSDAASLISEAVSIVEDVKSELEDWASNLPENFSDKQSEIEDTVSSLDEAINNAQSAQDELDNVEIPGAFGR